MALNWQVLVILVQAFIISVKLCEIPEADKHLVKSLNLKLLRTTLDTSIDGNPSVYVGLRLSEDHNLEKEEEYFQRLKTPIEAVSNRLGIKEGEPKTGLLALQLMAQKLSCDNIDTSTRNKLIKHMKYHLHKEKESIALNDKPLSNYYQYSLGILAMCVNDKFVDRHVVHKLILAEEQKKFVHGESGPVDTQAMAGLALQCVKRFNNYPRELIMDIKNSVKRIKDTILRSQNTDGELGNLYSTPLAVQFLLALGGRIDQDLCLKAITALMNGLKEGKFSNPQMMSQLMPVMFQKSYLDVAKVDCKNIINDPLLIPSSPTLHDVVVGEDLILVRLVVEGQNINEMIEVPSRSSLLDVLKTAQKQNSKFSFETKNTLHGPFLTTVNKVAGYWQLLKDPNITLLQGIADYRPEHGETIILRHETF
ncbi:transcobalamin-2 isoform X2 [Hyla sarda]|uniref:transcobalamin-2 isoform X2 n=1 Tax=Hyla sarda TaxID=327740 RepID=UPI0024C35EF4|nr:transcobalamin-2 isoform X2 [Hyla sarda]